MTTVIDFTIIFVLILLNGMFVGAEFAIIGVRATRIEQLAAEGNIIAKRLHDTLTHPPKVDRYIASCQLGITLASLGLGMYGEPAIARLIEPPLHDWFGLEGEVIHTISFFTALIVITYLHVVVGEMVPKSIALQNAERAVIALAAPMVLMQSIFALPITGLNKLGFAVLRMLRVPVPAEGSRLHTPDELALIVSDSMVGGLIEREEQRMISKIFDFSHLHVNQIMTPRRKIDAVPIGISEADLMQHMFNSPHSRLPVYENNLDEIIGILHLKDLIHQQIEHRPYDLPSLLHKVPFVPETMMAETLLARLKKEHVHMAIVMDEYGGTAGLITLEDLIEEVVGDVRDEFDTHESAPVTVIAPGHLLALGSTRLDELAEYVHIQAPEADVESIGGLMLTMIDLPPVVGEEVELDGLRLRVEEVNGISVERVAILYTPAAHTP